MSLNATLTAIEAEFLNEEGWKKTSPLDREAVCLRMDSTNLEVLGAVHHLLFVKEHLPRVVPFPNGKRLFARGKTAVLVWDLE